MQEEKQIIITNGSGSSSIINGNYDVTSNINGYDNTSVNPSNITVTDDTIEFEFTISANGTFTINVNETGLLDGTPIVGATFVRCDSSGTNYGTPITSNAQGNVIFNNIPYNEDGSITIYFKQTASDGLHNFNNELASVVMNSQEKTEIIQNKLPTEQTFKLTDLNYSNLPIDNGTIILNKN